MGLVIAWKVCQLMSKHILNQKSRLNLKRIQEVQVQMCCCTSESNRSLCVIFWNPSGFNARMGLLTALEKYKFKRVVAQVSRTDHFALYLGIRVDLMFEWDS
ncbi:uncharacterized protein G2W53_010408 [Senna tora]|uniref:Uncharacterized protein n=1 Tax=Senna tora TaxID=362788 RepID=A0A834X071_9FABA|nr:uncharacterized protein G2W53_010408 [Senna tora]